jgi:hypothetical protein
VLLVAEMALLEAQMLAFLRALPTQVVVAVVHTWLLEMVVLA